MELTHSLGRFFDRALYSAAIGYERASREEVVHAGALEKSHDKRKVA
jgi:hypothetical protein